MNKITANIPQAIDNVAKNNISPIVKENNMIALVIVIGAFFILNKAIEKDYSFTASFSKGKEVKISLDPKDKSN